jgi:Lsr2
VASKTILTCDVCGEEAVNTATLGLVDATYEVDLCDRHSKALKTAAKPFTAVARTSGARRTARPAQRTPAKKTNAKAVAASKPAVKRSSTKKAIAKKASTQSTPRRRARTSDTSTAEIRAWGQANGFAVGLKGRLRPDVIEAFNAAQQPSK